MIWSRIITALTTLPNASANRDDGYFGWTDRYGIRAHYGGAHGGGVATSRSDGATRYSSEDGR